MLESPELWLLWKVRIFFIKHIKSIYHHGSLEWYVRSTTRIGFEKQNTNDQCSTHLQKSVYRRERTRLCLQPRLSQVILISTSALSTIPLLRSIYSKFENMCKEILLDNFRTFLYKGEALISYTTILNFLHPQVGWLSRLGSNCCAFVWCGRNISFLQYISFFWKFSDSIIVFLEVNAFKVWCSLYFVVYLW